MQGRCPGVAAVRVGGPLAELLAKVDLEIYSPCLRTVRGTSVMCGQIQRALYGSLAAALLCWNSRVGQLTSEGFEANPYDSCVMNKMENGKQCTVLWHVDDLKISHVDPQVNEGVLARLNTRYGQETVLTVTRGDIHDYLGMTIDYSTDGKVVIRMDDYVENMLDEVPDDMSGVHVTPAADPNRKMPKKRIV